MRKISKQGVGTTAVQLLKYGIVGVGNTLITLGVFYILNTHLGLSYGVSNVLSYIAGMINSFLWNRAWVFKSSGKIRRQAVVFVCGFLVCMALQGLVSYLLLEPCGMAQLTHEDLPILPMKNPGQNIVMVISNIVYTIANYVYNRTITFREK